ncbi:uncharacterized protein LOC136065732 [Quercus suber]|uniref:uncharacterized protein LOC136065732 n=1 Tax=Quercus suber TaxID=58331 RepID=UPI0032DE5CB0
MPFGLKNAGATYQRLMNKMFARQIGRNVQVYVDDMLVKSQREEDHLEDLRETFNTLHSYNMKLNPGKCAFGVTVGKFLGFMVSQRGIEANPDKIRAIMEMAPPKNVKEVQSLNGKIAVLNRGAEESPQWSIHVDGSSNRQVGGAGVILQSPEGDTVECMVRLEFPTTNNEAEYEALIAGLDLVKAAGAEKVIIYCDSQVIVNQISGEYECKGERMKKYLDQARRRMNELKVKIIQIPRGENEQANRLAKAASAEHMATISNTLSFTQLSPLIHAVDVQELGPQNDWTTPLTSFLKNGILQNEKEAARKLKVQAARFVLIRDVLYKRGFSRPYLLCLGPGEADYVMREVQRRNLRNHLGSRSLVHKLVRTGYFWPTMQKDAEAYVKACDKCQRFSNVIRQPPEELTLMTAPWSFRSSGVGHHGAVPTAIR